MVNHQHAKLLAAWTERRLSEFKMQNLSRTAWAFATVSDWNAKLFTAALARVAERLLGEFDVQGVANTAWALATVKHQGYRQYASLAPAAER